jgi:Bax protein
MLIKQITGTFFLFLVLGFMQLQSAFAYTSPSQSSKPTIDLSDQKGKPVPNFAAIKDVKQKKRAFFSYIRPHVLAMNEKIKQQRATIIAIHTTWKKTPQLSEEEQAKFMKIADRYHVDLTLPFNQIYAELIKRVDVIPAELVLVQAANESAWGTSRFAKQGKNFFGIWCYKKGCGIVPKKRNKGAVHEVAKFDTVAQCIEHYFFNLNTHGFYKDFRQLRFKLRQKGEPITADKLAAGLKNYSERRQAYVDELRAMIRHNKPYFGLPKISY